jgi:hypothetical protein
MSFSIKFFGPSDYCWRANDMPRPRAWFHRPDDDSTGGAGFCIPGLHVCFMWGRK